MASPTRKLTDEEIAQAAVKRFLYGKKKPNTAGNLDDQRMEAVYQQMAAGKPGTPPKPNRDQAAPSDLDPRMEAVFNELATRKTPQSDDEIAQAAVDRLLYGQKTKSAPDYGDEMGGAISTVTGRPIRPAFPKRAGDGMVEIEGRRIPEEQVRMVEPPDFEPARWRAGLPRQRDPEQEKVQVASPLTEVVATWTDDQRAKLRTYASRRFPNLRIEDAIRRYGITQDGELVFKADDGQVYRESQGPAARFVADNFLGGGSTPANVMAATMAPAGWTASALGAMGGRGYQQAVDSGFMRRPEEVDTAPVELWGKPVPGVNKQTIKNAVFMALEGVAEKIGDWIGAPLTRGTSDTLRASVQQPLVPGPTKETAGALKRMEGDFRDVMAPGGEAQRLDAVAEQYMGGRLNVPSKTGMKSAENLYAMGASDPRTADLMRGDRNRMGEMARTGVENFRRELAPDAPADPIEAGQRIAEIGRRAIDAERARPGQIAGPLYRRAYQNAPPEGVDLDPVADVLQEIQDEFYPGEPVHNLARGILQDLKAEPDVIEVGRRNVLPDFRRGGEALTPDASPGTSTPAPQIQGPTLQGRPATAFTPDNQPIETVYAVQDIRDVVASHSDDMRPNPAYPQELQPKDRSTDALIVQVDDISGRLNPERLAESPEASTGAPIVGPDNLVESGNGRVLAIRRAYGRGAGDNYRRFIQENAGRFGIDPDQVRNIEYPVLTRMRTADVDRAAFARAANRPTTSRLAPADQARADAATISSQDMELFRPDKAGDITAASNRPFVQRFLRKQGIEETAGLVSGENAGMTPELVNRIRAAVFHKAYDNPQLLRIMAEETQPGIRRILDGLTTAAPEFAQAKAAAPGGNLGEFDIPGRVADAVSILRRARQEGATVDQVLKQAPMFADDAIDPATARIARFLEENKRSSNKVGAFLQEAGRRVKRYYQNLDQMDLFGDSPTPTIDDVLSFAEMKAKDTPADLNVGGSTAGGMVLGTGAGIEQDDDGNWTLDPRKALGGMAAGALGATALSRIGGGGTGLRETNVRRLHNLRKRIDGFLSGKQPFEFGRVKLETTSADADTINALKRIRGALDQQLKEIPLFETADRTYKQMRERYVAPLINSIVDKSSKLQGDRESIRALNTLFKADQELTPFAVARARKMIEAKDPKAWRDAASHWMGLQVKNAVAAAEDAGDKNIPRAIVNRLWKTENQADIMKVALPGKSLKTFEDLMTIMDRMGRLYSDNSATAGRMHIYELMEKEALKTPFGRMIQGAGAVAKVPSLLSPEAWGRRGENVHRWGAGKILFSNHLEKVMKGLINPTPEIEKQIAKVKGMPPANPAFADALGRLLFMGAYHAAKDEYNMAE